MATSRTGTTKWLRLAAHAKRRARADGLTSCPLCGTTLDYDHGKQPDSAEADHVIEWANGGQDELDNIRVICRRCNQRLGGALGHKRARRRRTQPLRIAPTATTSTW